MYYKYRSRSCTCVAIMKDPDRHFKECPERREVLPRARKIAAKIMAREALLDLAKNGLIYAICGDVHARGDKTDERLAEWFEAFAAGKDTL